MSVYKVTGKASYRGHQPGSIFHASLDNDAERRAILRGALQILDDTPPGLVPGSYQPPAGWHPPRDLTEAPTRGLSH